MAAEMQLDRKSFSIQGDETKSLFLPLEPKQLKLRDGVKRYFANNTFT